MQRWIAGFRRSLAQGDEAAFLALFAEDASFQMSPFEAPLHGPDIGKALHEYRGRQGGGEWRMDIWADRGDTAILHWSTEAIGVDRAMLGDGILILRFGPDGRCRQARHWHHWHPVGAPLSAGFVENPALSGQAAQTGGQAAKSCI